MPATEATAAEPAIPPLTRLEAAVLFALVNLGMDAHCDGTGSGQAHRVLDAIPKPHFDSLAAKLSRSLGR